MDKIRKFLSDESGATDVEKGLIAALIVFLAVLWYRAEDKPEKSAEPAQTEQSTVADLDRPAAP